MKDHGRNPNFCVRIPKSCKLTFKTVKAHLRRQMRLDSLHKISLFVIERPVDIYNQTEALGRLKDWQNVHVVMYQVMDCDPEADLTSSSEEDEAPNEGSLSAGSESSMSITETEKSHESQPETLEQDLRDMIASVMGLLVIKK